MTQTQNRKNSSKYARIRTTEELNAAIKSVHAEQTRLGRQLEKEAHTFVEHIKPAYLVSNVLQKASPYFAWSEIGLGLVRGLKRLISPKKKTLTVKSEAPQSSQPAEESPSVSES